MVVAEVREAVVEEVVAADEGYDYERPLITDRSLHDDVLRGSGGVVTAVDSGSGRGKSSSSVWQQEQCSGGGCGEGSGG